MKATAKPVPVFVVATPEGLTLRRANADVRTPAGAPLIVPTKALADAIAAEWNAQYPKIDFAAMPLTQLALTAIDVIGPDRAKTVDVLAAFAATDLLCHRAEHPPALAERQHRLWQPLLDWCKEHFRAPLAIASGLLPIKQPQASLVALRRALEAYDDFRLAGLKQTVASGGSLILGLALAEGHSDAAAAFEAAEIDTVFQMEKWGEDPVLSARHAAIKRELDVCERWFGLLNHNLHGSSLARGYGVF